MSALLDINVLDLRARCTAIVNKRESIRDLEEEEREARRAYTAAQLELWSVMGRLEEARQELRELEAS